MVESQPLMQPSVAGEDLRRAVDRLLESTNPSDLRKGRDLRQLSELSEGLWNGRFAPAALIGLSDERLGLLAMLKVAGLIWSDGPQAHDAWTLLITLPRHYPLASATVQFVGHVPYNPHVVHRAFVPDRAGLPAELHSYVAAVRSGQDGGCCFVRHTQWAADVTCDLSLLVWQVSRLLCGARIHGERSSLNDQARDHYLQLRDKGQVPLGPALPFPHGSSQELCAGFEDSQQMPDCDEAVEWLTAGPDTTEGRG